MSHALGANGPDTPVAVIINAGAQQQAVKIVRSGRTPVFCALVGGCQGNRCWITDLQDAPPVWENTPDHELVIESGETLSRWYDGYRAGLRLARLSHLGWWQHCGEAPPQAVEEVLRMSEFARLLMRPERHGVRPSFESLPSVLLLLTWLEGGAMRYRVLEIDSSTRQVRDIPVLL